MGYLSGSEFVSMERLLAGLLVGCDSSEQAKLIDLHLRLESIWRNQDRYSASFERLQSLANHN